jgi:hypothetical protein
MTLRELCEMLEPEFLDAELTFSVRDGHLNTSHATGPKSLWDMPRQQAYPGTGEPARLTIAVNLDGYRLVADRKR